MRVRERSVSYMSNSCRLYHIRACTEVNGKLYPVSCHEGPEEEKRYSSTLSLTSAIDGSGWSTPRSGLFTSGKRLVTHCTGDSLGPRASLDGYGKSRPHRDSIHGLSVPQRDVPPTTPSRSTEWCLYVQEIKPNMTRDICSAKVKTFRWLVDVVPDESRNFDILVDGKIHNLEWEFCGLHRQGFIFSESEWGGLREKHVVATWDLGNIPAFFLRSQENHEPICRYIHIVHKNRVPVSQTLRCVV